MGGLNKRIYFSQFWSQEVQIRVQPWSGSGESPLPDLQVVIFLLCAHTAEIRERENKLSHVSFFLRH